jgi:hypothetical protein
MNWGLITVDSKMQNIFFLIEIQTDGVDFLCRFKKLLLYATYQIFFIMGSKIASIRRFFHALRADRNSIDPGYSTGMIKARFWFAQDGSGSTISLAQQQERPWACSWASETIGVETFFWQQRKVHLLQFVMYAKYKAFLIIRYNYI